MRVMTSPNAQYVFRQTMRRPKKKYIMLKQRGMFGLFERGVAK